MVSPERRLDFLLRLFFPPKCSVCSTLLPWRAPNDRVKRGASVDAALCADCKGRWMEAEREECEICALEVRECLCMPQLLKAARMQALFKLVYYVPGDRGQTQNRVVYHIKEEDEKWTPYFLAERLSPEIAEGLRDAGIDPADCVLTYLPRSKRAACKYGFDQSKVLARELSRILGIPMRPLLRRRAGANQVQKHLSAEAREKNARRSFRLARRASCEGQTVLLVDDVVTTGAGMAACTRLLYSGGARRVLGVAVAVDDINRDNGVMGKIRRDGWNEKWL